MSVTAKPGSNFVWIVCMGSVMHSKYSTIFHDEKIEILTLWRRFSEWARSQQDNRFLWMTFAIVGHSVIFTPTVLAVVFFSGNHFIYWPIAILAMMACLTVNLSGLPTKYTIPVFFISLIIDAIIIFSSLTNGINLNAGNR